MPSLSYAALASLWAAALSTFGDFVWARFITSHHPAYGLAHGTALCLGIGLCLSALHPRPGGADYVHHFLSWTIAFLPGFVFLLARRPGSPA